MCTHGKSLFDVQLIVLLDGRVNVHVELAALVLDEEAYCTMLAYI